MARIIQTADLQPGEPASDTEKLWVYNGLDCTVTLEVLFEIEKQLNEKTQAVYDFERSLMGCILEMNMRGMRVDKARRDHVIDLYNADIRRLSDQLNTILQDGIGACINWNSPAQMKELFYETMGIPPIRKRNAQGGFSPTVDRGALEKLENYFLAQPVVRHLLTLRDLSKKVGVLRTKIDNDGRIRTSFNIGGTTTGRLASSMSDFGTGTNLQNIEERLRSIFVADPGKKLAYIDLEQAESRAVGGIIWNLFNDGSYLDACESVDLHTSVCRMGWRNLPWTGDLAADKRIAEAPFYRQYSYRDMAKRLGHGTNYYGQPFTMAKQTKIEQPIVAQFQAAYFSAFPGIPRWHQWVITELREKGYLYTLGGGDVPERLRWFFGRRDEDETVRAAIAYSPQGAVGNILNRGMLQVWRLGICELLLQIHDAIVIQYPEELEDEIIPKVREALTVEVPLARGRSLVIPNEVKVGWNWASETKANPGGLIKYKGTDRRVRPNILDTVL